MDINVLKSTETGPVNTAKHFCASYLYVLDDLGVKGVIVGVGWDF